MNAESILSQVQIASPCTARWSAMKGDDRVRFCDQCQLQVYNLSAMSAAAVSDLVTRTEGRLCGRYLMRRDGTILTNDCPVGARTARMQRFTRVASAFVLGCTSLLGGTYLLARNGDTTFDEHGGSVRTLVNWVRTRLGLASLGAPAPARMLPARMLMGKISTRSAGNEMISSEDY
jgi:hypothetical protein